jgi:beta-glucosidase
MYASEKPLYAFGHGLSYNTYKYSNLETNKKEINKKEKVNVSFTLTNTGNKIGDEVVQLYIQLPKSNIPQPIKALKGFKKITLNKGETKQIELELTPDDLSYWNEKMHHWAVQTGKIKVLVGSASDNILLSTFITVI